MENPQEMSQEDMEALRDKMDNYYKAQIPFLKTQSEFETLLASIEEARFKRAHYNNQLVGAMQAQQEAQEKAKPKGKSKLNKA